MRKKQAAVSHSSAESETKQLDVGLRMEGVPADQLWDSLLETFAFSDAGRDPQRPSGERHSHSIEHMSRVVVDHVQCNIPQSSCPAMLFMFENSEADISVIIQGGSPNFRHTCHASTMFTWIGYLSEPTLTVLFAFGTCAPNNEWLIC